MSTRSSDTRRFSKKQVKSRQLLDGFCEGHGLHLGQYAIRKGIDPTDYFMRYGLSEAAYRIIRTHFGGAETTDHARDNGDLQREMAAYADDHGLECRWCPRYIHVYEMIRGVFQNFSWKLDYEQQLVVFSNYPQLLGNESPTLFELVSQSVQIDPDYRFVKQKKARRVTKFPRRTRRQAAGWRSY